MKVATIAKKITPENKFYMVGYLSKERELPALGLHDDPLCVGILLEIKEKKILLISLDVCIIEKEKADLIKDELEKVIDIDRNDIVISTIHTHSASSGLGGADMATQDNPEYLELVIEKVLECAKELQSTLQDATAEVGKTDIRGYYSNRNDINKPFDDEGLIIRFKNEDHKVIAAICNFNCHSTVVGPQNRYGTSDLIGEVRKNLTGFLGVTPYSVPGACADVSNRKYRQGNDFAELERVGKGVADALKKIDNYQKINLDQFNLKIFNYSVHYDNRKYFDNYKNELDKTNRQLATDLSVDGQKLLIAQRKMLNQKLETDAVDFKVTCKIFELGDLEVITYPGELASRFGIKLKAKSKKNTTMVITCADDYTGYFIEAEDFGKSYEAIATRVPKGVAEKIVGELEGKL